MADMQVRSNTGFKRFFGLSRMSHSVLDVAHPAVGAALAAVVLGGASPARTSVLGLLAGFAGYTAVFALNDVIDLKAHREKMARYRVDRETFNLGSLGQRHPLAQGSLSYGAGVAWAASWGPLSRHRLTAPPDLALSSSWVPSFSTRRTASCFASPIGRVCSQDSSWESGVLPVLGR
jgi:hypothetical protein